MGILNKKGGEEMRSRKVICEELEEFVKQPNKDFKLTYESKLLEAIFELLLDIRDIELRPIVATVGDKEKWKKSIKK